MSTLPRTCVHKKTFAEPCDECSIISHREGLRLAEEQVAWHRKELARLAPRDKAINTGTSPPNTGTSPPNTGSGVKPPPPMDVCLRLADIDAALIAEGWLPDKAR